MFTCGDVLFIEVPQLGLWFYLCVCAEKGSWQKHLGALVCYTVAYEKHL